MPMRWACATSSRLTGDPPRVGDYPTGTGVWDVDSIGLIEILTRLNRGEDQAGSPIGHRASFTIACALDPTAHDAATEWDRLERKLDAGAHLVMTQPLYDSPQVETMLAEARRRFGPRGFPVPVLLGVLPLVTSRHAEFLHNEVPGITIPDAARARDGRRRGGGHRGRDRDGGRAARRRGGRDGRTYLMPSFGRYEQAAELVRRIRARHPPRRTSRARSIPQCAPFAWRWPPPSRPSALVPSLRPGRRTPVPGPGRQPGRLRHRGRPGCRDHQQGRGQHRQDRGRHGRRDRGLHPARPRRRQQRRGRGRTPSP